MKKIYALPLLLLLALTAFSQTKEPAREISGDWIGTLSADGTDLRFILHIAKGSNGYKATLDSLDEAHANGIPVSSISLDSDTVNMALEKIHATYNGKLNADGSEIHGTWMQTRPVTLDFKRVAAPKPSDIDGAWRGALDAGGMRLHIVLHVTNTAFGLVATMDVPDQSAKGVPASAMERDGDSVTIMFQRIAASFSGKLSKDSNTIDGSWSQSGSILPLTLARVKNASELVVRRPQEPSRPYPYKAEDVSYENPSQGVSLAATLTIPEGKGPFPAVVLITGSGPQDRDETIFAHHPFLVLADYLTRRGVAVLRADDRGVAKSTGNFATATTADFATDTEAGIAYLKTRPEIDPHRIGLIGHSEGGIIAPMIAARNADVAFIVMMAGSGVTGRDILLAQERAMGQAAGASVADLDKDAQRHREMFDLIAQEKDQAVLAAKLRDILSGMVPEGQIGAHIKVVTSPWFRYFLVYDPAPVLAKVKCPVLAINGSKDLQVLPAQNLPAVRSALKSGGNTDYEVDELSGLNHLFQTAKTGALSEYGEIEETIAPLALDTIGDWILKHSAGTKASLRTGAGN